MKNYIEMNSWITKNADHNITKTKSTSFSHEEKVKDITMSVLTAKNTINKQLRFTDAFPTSLGELAFTTQDTAVEYLTCTVSFRYNRFEFIR